MSSFYVLTTNAPKTAQSCCIVSRNSSSPMSYTDRSLILLFPFVSQNPVGVSFRWSDYPDWLGRRFRGGTPVWAGQNRRTGGRVSAGGLQTGWRIRFHLIRIRIQHFRLNTDPDPIRIQGFWWPKIGKNYSWKKIKKFFFFQKLQFTYP